MGHARSALLVALQLPMAALATFLTMELVGLSANLMTLSGIAIAIGMLGDGAIVLVENTVRLLSDQRDDARTRLAMVRKSAAEVARPIFFGVAVIIVVFLPIASLRGMEGKMFAPLAYTISIAMGCALLLSMTLMPALSSLLLRRVPDLQDRALPPSGGHRTPDLPAPAALGARPSPVGGRRGAGTPAGGGADLSDPRHRVLAGDGRGVDRGAAIPAAVGVVASGPRLSAQDRSGADGAAGGGACGQPHRTVGHIVRSHGRRRERRLRDSETAVRVDNRGDQAGAGRGDSRPDGRDTRRRVRLYPADPNAGRRAAVGRQIADRGQDLRRRPQSTRWSRRPGGGASSASRWCRRRQG